MQTLFNGLDVIILRKIRDQLRNKSLATGVFRKPPEVEEVCINGICQYIVTIDTSDIIYRMWDNKVIVPNNDELSKTG